jgi:hypothetical protein
LNAASEPGLDRRIQRLEDRGALRDLSNDYCRAVDDRHLTVLGELFCAGGEFGHADGTMQAVGRSAILDFYRERFVGMGPSVHIAHAQRLDSLDQQSATGTVTGSALMAIAGRTIAGAIRYQDRYEKSSGNWQFASRSLRFWYLLPLDELPYRLGEEHRRRWPGAPLPVLLPESLETWRAFYG